MEPSQVELQLVVGRAHRALDRWGLSEEDRHRVLMGSVRSSDGASGIKLEERLRHIADVDRAIASLLSDDFLHPVWLRLPQDGLHGMAPITLLLADAPGLGIVRRLLARGRLDRAIS